MVERGRHRRNHPNSRGGDALKANLVVYEMTHADEVIRETRGGICPTLQSRMGTGGNQVPMIVEAVGLGRDAFSSGTNEKFGMSVEENLQLPMAEKGAGCLDD